MYVKLFSSLFDGSIRGKPDLILVFVNMLARAMPDGTDDRHIRAISDETGLSLDRVQKAINELEAPDPESRTEAEDGRRIKRLSETRKWGWLIVNYERYRNTRDEESRRAQYRAAYYRKQGRLAQASDDDPSVDDPSTCLTLTPHASSRLHSLQHHSTRLHNVPHASTQAETETKTKTEAHALDSARAGEASPSSPLPAPMDFELLWTAYPRKSGKDAARRAYEAVRDRMPSIEEVVASVQAQAASYQWTREGGRFVPGLAKWLERGQWADEPSQVAPEDKAHVRISNSMNREDYQL